MSTVNTTDSPPPPSSAESTSSDISGLGQTITMSVATSNEVFKASKQSTFPWDDLPFELREQIFKELDDEYQGYWEDDDSYFHMDFGKIPHLVVALRGFKQSYEHVLQWFKAQNTPLELNIRTRYDLSMFSDAEALAVEEIELDLMQVHLASYKMITF